MSFKRIFWPVFRVAYFVCIIVDVTMGSVILSPPPQDGNGVRQLTGMLLINTLMVVIGWAFLPWPRPELDTPSKKPAPVPEEPKGDLEEICGQESLEDFLEKRRAQNPER